MKIYLVQRTTEIEYDQFSAFVCYASSANKARQMNPEHTVLTASSLFSSMKYEWPDQRGSLTVTYLGEAPKGERTRVILSSYHAG